MALFHHRTVNMANPGVPRGFCGHGIDIDSACVDCLKEAQNSGDLCVVCRAPLPPLAQWSMPACPKCTAAAEQVQLGDERGKA